MKKAPSQQSVTAGRILSPYDRTLLEGVVALGGFYNAHGHLDRADTLDDIYLSHMGMSTMEAASMPLSVKQQLTGYLHTGPAYTEEDLRARMSRVIERQIAYGATSFDTCIDVTPDIGEDGMLAWRISGELQKEFTSRIKIRRAPNPIFGFKHETERWEVYRKAAASADYLSGLPEKDDFSDVSQRDGRVGFKQHMRMVLELGCELHKEVHFHLDQANDPNEKGAETLINALEWFLQPQIPGHQGPTVWAIHAISPSAYTESRFGELAQGLLKHNIGVIVCPTAAISMRQLRPLLAPTHNSIARVMELAKLGISLRLGSDNICDVFVPQGDGDMLTEIKMAGHAVRLALPSVWAKLGAGVALNRVDRTAVGRWLYEDRKSFVAADPNWQPAVA